ncbi:MAG: CopG family transcriptional regulator [Candidatus Marinimicrobia bacterium]|nr:CopG family transcriptional regulator [Candidatus Neomarinimicrobiota bacterium]
MNRTQIYITKEEQQTLKRLSKLTGKSKSELIRDAIDKYIHDSDENNWKDRVRAAAGLWKDRTDLPDFDLIRDGLDRS